MTTFLHGFLYISINEAKGLPDADKAFFNLVKKDVSDPYVNVFLGPCCIATTTVIDNNLSPKWFEHFTVPVCHFADTLVFKVKDKDYIGSADLGSVSVQTKKLLSGTPIKGWFDLVGSGARGKLNIEVRYNSRQNLEQTLEVPCSYFPLRENCKVTLYQDAHCTKLPSCENVTNPDGTTYNPPCAWKDVYEAMLKAKRLIYIIGWSVFTEISLLREEGDERITVGELIKQKAMEGVRVLMMIWNEKMSTDITPGLMGTHDEDTRTYFADTDVDIVLVPRSKPVKRDASKLRSFLVDQFIQTCYTHHQKTIILDAPSVDGSCKPRIIAFLGGLDLTHGRWDTPEHTIFKSLTSYHRNDFHNGCAHTTVKEGPRLPWHDIHCKLEGAVALDVLQNFTERWRKQVSDLEGRLYDITSDNFNLSGKPAADADVWSVQLFRSINTDSALFLRETMKFLTRRKGKRLDDSIHRAYVHHIRRAHNYLYIENQYFFGSAHGWLHEQEITAYHLLPIEIVEKIVDKMNNGEHFVTYIIIPMFPEGDPTSAPVQEILHWQTKTMEMMYKKIAEAIQANGLDTHPSDYLSFYCLGKREGPEEVPEDLSPPTPGTVAEMLRQKLRFLIYVHSKMMITDDEYIIVGSANVNQRSMGGNRDTEIAMGAYQPHFIRETPQDLPRGSVHAFRMSLWAEHLGVTEEVFQNPGSLACARRVNELAHENWQTYTSDTPQHMDSHLLRYPVHVEQDGSVSALPNCTRFPDTKASILGSRSKVLPVTLTT